MAKKARAQESASAGPCPRCTQLEDELQRSEQRSFDRLREITDRVNELQEQLEAAQRDRASREERWDEAVRRLRSLRESLSRD